MQSVSAGTSWVSYSAFKTLELDFRSIKAQEVKKKRDRRIREKIVDSWVKEAGSKKCKVEEGNADEQGKDGLAEGKERVASPKLWGLWSLRYVINILYQRQKNLRIDAHTVL